VRCLSLDSAEWPAMILTQHREITHCVVTGDEKAAEAAMRKHLRTVFDAIETIARHQVDAFAGTAPIRPD
jgi:DNA-binding FadR family transcriptional regulator